MEDWRSEFGVDNKIWIFHFVNIFVKRESYDWNVKFLSSPEGNTNSLTIAFGLMQWVPFRTTSSLVLALMFDYLNALKLMIPGAICRHDYETTLRESKGAKW